MTESNGYKEPEVDPHSLFEKRLDVFCRAQAGEFEPFAKFIEEGNHLDREMRLWLAAYLRGELKWKRGNRRSIGQMSADQEILRTVENLMREKDIKRAEAIRILLDKDPSLNCETIKKQLKRAKNEFRKEVRIGPPYR